MGQELIRAAALAVSRWPNGAGRKADLARGEGWLVGYAWLDADAPFSDLAGFDRTITLVEGPGFTLDIAGRAPLVVSRACAPARFDGGAGTVCRVAGACRVLNVMTERTQLRHSVVVGGAGEVTAAGEVACFVVVLRGAGVIGGMRVGMLDAVRVGGGVMVEGDLIVAAVSVERL